MQRNEVILTELAEISNYIASLSLDQPFLAPDGYFENFPSKMMDLVSRLPVSAEGHLLEQQPLLAPFEVPENYFENLASQVLQRIKDANPAEELKNLSPLLAKLEKKNPFSAPDGYFEEMPANVTAGIHAIDFVQ